MKKTLRTLSLVAMSALFALTGCKTTNDSGSNSGSNTKKVEFIELPETDIGTKTKPEATKLSSFTEANPLKLGLVTDSGTLNDHSFNESAWDGINEFAVENGGGTVNTSSNSVETGKIQTHYVQPASGQYTTAGRKAAIDSVISWGAKVVVLPGYLFESVLARGHCGNARDERASACKRHGKEVDWHQDRMPPRVGCRGCKDQTLHHLQEHRSQETQHRENLHWNADLVLNLLAASVLASPVMQEVVPALVRPWRRHDVAHDYREHDEQRQRQHVPGEGRCWVGIHHHGHDVQRIAKVYHDGDSGADSSKRSDD